MSFQLLPFPPFPVTHLGVWQLFGFFFFLRLCVCVCARVWRKTDPVQVEITKGDQNFVPRVRAVAVIFLSDSDTTEQQLLLQFYFYFTWDFLQATWVPRRPSTHPPPKQDMSASAEGWGPEPPPGESPSRGLTDTRVQAADTCPESRPPGWFLQNLSEMYYFGDKKKKWRSFVNFLKITNHIK